MKNAPDAERDSVAVQEFLGNITPFGLDLQRRSWRVQVKFYLTTAEDLKLGPSYFDCRDWKSIVEDVAWHVHMDEVHVCMKRIDAACSERV